MNQSDRNFQDEMEHDAFVEGLMSAWEVVVRNRTLVIVLLVAIVAAVLGGLAVKRSADLNEGRASVVVNRAVMLFDQGEYAQAKHIFEQAGTDFSGAVATQDASYFLGMCALNDGQLSEARESFEAYLALHSVNEFLTAAAHGGLASCFERENKWAEASSEWTKASLVGSGNFQADRHLLNAALCCELAGDNEEALQLLDRLLEKYPATSFKSRVELIHMRVQNME